MTDYAPDYTFRYKVRYLAGGFQHDMVVRGPLVVVDPATQNQLLADVLSGYFVNLQTVLYNDFEFQTASYAVAGSNVFIPTTIVPISPVGVVSVANSAARQRASACTHAGRGIGSGSGRLYFFGLAMPDSAAGDPAADGVISVTNLPGLATATGIADGTFKSSSGAAMAFYPRLTIKVNDAMLRIVRRTIST